jgi:hypothetical protein
MARKSVIEVACARCERVEHRASVKDGEASTPPVLLATLWAEDDSPLKVSFDDLCTPCIRTVRALLEQIGKKIEGVSPDRQAKPKEKAPATPAPPAAKKGEAANGPAHPSIHSAGGGKAPPPTRVS